VYTSRGQRQQQVVLQFGVNVSTVERLVRRLRNTRRVADRPRRGRPRITTPRQDRAICLAHLRNRHVTATETARLHCLIGNCLGPCAANQAMRCVQRSRVRGKPM
jgi:transposase